MDPIAARSTASSLSPGASKASPVPRENVSTPSDSQVMLSATSQPHSPLDVSKVADILTKKSDVSGEVAVVWEKETKHYDSNASVAANGNIYEGGLCDSTLRCLSPKGDLLWEKVTEANSVNPAAAPDGTVYVSRIISLKAFNADGSLRWDLPLPGKKDMERNSLCSQLAVGSDGTAYIFDYGHLFAVDPGGKVKWKKDLEHAWTDDPPVIGPDGTIYCLDRQTTLYAFNENGSLKWKNTDMTQPRKEFGNMALITTRLAPGPDGSLYFGTGDGRLVCLDERGKFKWDVKMDKEMDHYASPSVNQKTGTIYVGAGRYNEGIVAINPDGTQKWKNVTIGPVFHSTAAPDGKGVIVSIRGNTTHYINEEGALEWTYPHQITKPVFGSDGTIYAGAQKSILAFTTKEEFLKKLEKDAISGPGEHAPPQIEEDEGWIIIDNIKIPVNREESETK